MSVSVARDVTERVKPPRAVFVPFRMGHLFGVPFHRQLQREILLAMLERLTGAGDSGDLHDLPMTWARVRREGRAIEAAAG